jgi:ethanolamine permease
MFARLHPRFRTPDVATIAGGVVGVATIWSDNIIHIAGQSLTASVVTLSAMGALTMYILSMASLFRLRMIEPDLPRPFVAPAYPFAPGFALVMAAVALVMLVWNNPEIAAIFAVVMVGLVGGSLLFRQRGLQVAPA